MRVLVRVLAASLLLTGMATATAAREIWDRQPAHGRELMTRSERRTFWHEFLALQTDDERRAYWLAHNAKMDQRALDWGVSLEPARTEFPTEHNAGFWRPPYFPDIMTDEEVDSYRSDLDALPDRESRRQYVREHILRMQVRAARRGISIPSARRFDDVFDGITADEAGAAAIRRALHYEVSADSESDADSIDAGDADGVEADSNSYDAGDADGVESDADSFDAGEADRLEDAASDPSDPATP